MIGRPHLVPGVRDAALESMRDGVLVVDDRGRVLSANPAAEDLLAGPAGKLVGSSLDDLFTGGELPLAAAGEAGPAVGPGSFTAVVPGRGGSSRSLEILSSSLGPASPVCGRVLVMRDVTQRTAVEKKSRYKALHDELTGLPNRTLLDEHLKELLALLGRKEEGLALLLIDLHRFKEIDDTFGREAGDRLLRVVSQRLQAELRESDLVARLGGDEFAVLLPACGAVDAMRVASSLRRKIMAAMSLQNQQVSVTASIGVAVSPLHGRDATLLLSRAEVALSIAKDGVRGTALYHASHDPNSPQRRGLLHDLGDALEAGALRLYYQPEVGCLGSTVVRLEALARWPRADGSVIQPAAFIPLAEQNGLAPGLTSWALQTALHECSAWSAAGVQTNVAVNLSALDLHDEDLVKRVVQALGEAHLDARRLCLDTTETSVMSDPERARRALAELREMGVRVAIDDFGTGQSSLANLKRLPADEVKIDRSFISHVCTQPRNNAIVRAAITLAHDLGLSVSAEGVETAQELVRLGELGCDSAQGFFIARPMPADAVLGWLREHELVPRSPAAARGSLARPPRLATRTGAAPIA